MKQRMMTAVLAALIVAALAACGSADTGRLESGDITKNNVEQVGSVLEYAGLANVDVFEKWVSTTEGVVSGEGSADVGFSDADCRMTVMLLAGDLIKYDSVEDNYDGDYLMFDVDAIENSKEFSLLKDKKALLTTMFGEMPIPEGGFGDALSEKWRKHGITVESGKCSVISILFKAFKEEEAFVGHTGILIDCRENGSVESNYLFLEKIAFGEPFRITLIDGEKELIDVFSERPDYTVEEGEPAPVVFKNDEAIGELKTGGD